MLQRMLLVDDEKSFRVSATKLFERRGFHIDTAGSLLEAKERSAQRRYSFAIIDLKLPDTDGVEVARHLRQQQPDLPIFFLSGFDATEYRKKANAYRLEPIEWMHKPLTKQNLDPFCQTAPKRVFEARFLLLASIWRDGTQYSSSLNDVALHPAYQTIIGLGPSAVPLIIRELRRKPELWFWALTSITGENPISDAQRGRLDQMTAAWLDWAARNLGESGS